MDKTIIREKNIKRKDLVKLIDLYIEKLKFCTNISGLLMGVSLSSIIFIFTLTDYSIYPIVMTLLSVSFISLFICLSFFLCETIRLHSEKEDIETMKILAPYHSDDKFLVNSLLKKNWSIIKEDVKVMKNFRKYALLTGLVTMFLGIFYLMTYFLLKIIIILLVIIMILLIFIIFKSKKDISEEELMEKQDMAMNPNTAPETLRKLSEIDDEFIRNQVVRNSNTPEDVLKKFSKAKETFLRAYVAGNPNTPSTVLEKLAKDKDRYVRINVYNNKNTPESVLEKFSIKDDTDGVD